MSQEPTGGMDASGEDMPIELLLERAMQLAQRLHSSGDESSLVALELLDHLEAWHREGLTRLAMALPPEAMDAVRADPVVAHLLDVYLADDDDVVADDVVAEALQEIRPYIHGHGGEMQVVDCNVDTGVVTLALLGACDGCPSSSVTLTQGVEAILRERWPGFRELRVTGEVHEPAPNLLQIQSLRDR